MPEIAILPRISRDFDWGDEELDARDFEAKSGFKIVQPQPSPSMYIPRGRDWIIEEDDDNDFNDINLAATVDLSCPKLEDMPPLQLDPAEEDLPIDDFTIFEKNDTDLISTTKTIVIDGVSYTIIPTEAFASTVEATTRYAGWGITIDTPHSLIASARPNPVFHGPSNARTVLVTVALDDDPDLPAYPCMHTEEGATNLRHNYRQSWALMKANSGYDCRYSVGFIPSRLYQVQNADDEHDTTEGAQDDGVQYDEELSHAIEDENSSLENIQEEGFDMQHVQDLRSSMLNHQDSFRSSRYEDYKTVDFMAGRYERAMYDDEAFDEEEESGDTTEVSQHGDTKREEDDIEKVDIQEEHMADEIIEADITEEEQSEVHNVAVLTQQIYEAIGSLCKLTAEHVNHDIDGSHDESTHHIVTGKQDVADEGYHSDSTSLSTSSPELIADSASETMSDNGHHLLDTHTSLSSLHADHDDIAEDLRNLFSEFGIPKNDVEFTHTGDGLALGSPSTPQEEDDSSTDVITEDDLVDTGLHKATEPSNTPPSHCSLILQPKTESAEIIAPLIPEVGKEDFSTIEVAATHAITEDHHVFAGGHEVAAPCLSSARHQSLVLRQKPHSSKRTTIVTPKKVEESSSTPKVAATTAVPNRDHIILSLPEAVELLQTPSRQTSLVLQPKSASPKPTTIVTLEKVEEPTSTPKVPVTTNRETTEESTNTSSYLSELASRSWMYISSNPWTVASTLATGIVVVSGALHYARRR